MLSAESQSVVDRAKRLYAERLQGALEAEHRDRYVAIEPESGDHFLADTFDAAVEASWTRHPGRLSYTLRVGHPAALHIGGAWS